MQCFVGIKYWYFQFQFESEIKFWHSIHFDWKSPMKFQMQFYAMCSKYSDEETDLCVGSIAQ